MVEGLIVDGLSGEPVAMATLTLRNTDGSVAVRGESDAEGAFTLVARAPGRYTLEVEGLGYAPPDPLFLELGQEAVTVEVRLFPSPLSLEPITVTGRRRDVRHDATFEGALVRAELLPTVGPRRVVLRDGPEFVGAGRMSQVLQWFPPARGCRILFWDGELLQGNAAFWMNEASADWVEAVEFYRSWSDAPQDLKGWPANVVDPAGCSVIAFWSRLDPPESPYSTRRRLLTAVAVAVGLWLLLTLLTGS
jgi:hypothetical protein